MNKFKKVKLVMKLAVKLWANNQVFVTKNNKNNNSEKKNCKQELH